MLRRAQAICETVAMLSRSMGSRMEDVCAATGNDRQNDRSADHFVSPKMMAENVKIPVVKCNAEVVAMGLVSGNFRRCPAMEILKKTYF